VSPHLTCLGSRVLCSPKLQCKLASIQLMLAQFPLTMQCNAGRAGDRATGNHWGHPKMGYYASQGSGRGVRGVQLCRFAAALQPAGPLLLPLRPHHELPGQDTAQGVVTHIRCSRRSVCSPDATSAAAAWHQRHLCPSVQCQAVPPGSASSRHPGQLLCPGHSMQFETC